MSEPYAFVFSPAGGGESVPETTYTPPAGNTPQKEKIDKRNKIFSNIIVITSIFAAFLVFLCFLEDINLIDDLIKVRPEYIASRGGWERYLSSKFIPDIRYDLRVAFFAMVIPFIAAVSALIGRKKAWIPKIAAVVCVLFLGIQILAVLWYTSMHFVDYSEETLQVLYLTNGYINGIEIYDSIRWSTLSIKSGMDYGTVSDIWAACTSVFGILSNVLPTVALVICSFGIKASPTVTEKEKYEGAAGELRLKKEKRRAGFLTTAAVISLVLVGLSCILYLVYNIIIYLPINNYLWNFSRMTLPYIPRYMLCLLAPCACLVAARLQIKPGTRRVLNAVCILLFVGQIMGIGIYAIYDYTQYMSYIRMTGVDYGNIIWDLFSMIPDYTNGHNLLSVFIWGISPFRLISSISGLLGVASNFLSLLAMLIFNRKVK